jgi:hypothetical protein
MTHLETSHSLKILLLYPLKLLVVAMSLKMFSNVKLYAFELMLSCALCCVYCRSRNDNFQFLKNT